MRSCPGWRPSCFSEAHGPRVLGQHAEVHDTTFGFYTVVFRTRALFMRLASLGNRIEQAERQPHGPWNEMGSAAVASMSRLYLKSKRGSSGSRPELGSSSG